MLIHAYPVSAMVDIFEYSNNSIVMSYRILKQYVVLPLLLISILAAAQDEIPIGWASQNGGTTGGEGGDTTVVTTRSELLSIIGSSLPEIILIKDTVQLSLYERLIVGSNKSIIGMGTGGTLLGGGLEIKGENVIVRNLRITGSYDGDWDGKTHSTDAITITNSNVWIDHCDLSACADGLIDARAGSNSAGDFITISWTRLSNHNKVMLFGSSDDEIENRRKLRITIHHCWFDGYPERGVNQRMPRIRFGDVHLFNNFFDDVDSYCIAARFESDVVVENNFFRNSSNPHAILDQGLGMKDPELIAEGNVYEFSTGDKMTHGEAFDPATFYDYKPDTTEFLPTLIMNHAGLFNNPANFPPVAASDTIELEEGQRSVTIDALKSATDPDNDDLRISLILNADQLKGLTKIEDNMITYVAPGNSSVASDSVLYQVVDTKGGIDTGFVLINFGTTTSVSDIEMNVNQLLSIFPNPADQYAIIQYVSANQRPAVVRVFGFQGSALITQKSNHKSVRERTYEHSIDLSNLPVGVYWVQVDDDGHQVSRKFTIIR